jgi:hypothetical protein
MKMQKFEGAFAAAADVVRHCCTAEGNEGMAVTSLFF